eukprot:s2915_g3.t11
MGCCGSVNVDHPASAAYIGKTRSNGLGKAFLILGVKDQNMKGKVYLSGAATSEPQLLESVDKALKKTNAGVTRASDEHDKLWDVAWHNTKMTSGYQFMSFKQPFFPIGRNVVGLLDALGEHGWIPSAAPSYGGPIDDKVSVEWPMFICQKDVEQIYAKETLLIGIKDQNIPGKLCICGPPDAVEKLKGDFASRLKQVSPEANESFDDYDTAQEWDVVYRNTSLTSGMQAFSLAKPYFPKGNVLYALLEEVYKIGWRLVSSPNFGGNNVDWPCFIFKRLLNPPATPPALVFAAVKDQNIPGKLCLSGSPSHTGQVAKLLHGALRSVKGHDQVALSKDEYDTDWEHVIRNTSITTGHQAFSFKTAYFPRNDSIMALTRTMGKQGWKLIACPSFGGMGASWPTFFWEYDGTPFETAFVAIKDQNWPGKVCLGGVGKEVTEGILNGLKVMSGPDVQCAKDDYDQDYDIAFRNTKMTTGHACCSLQNSWWPYAYPMELILGELHKHKWLPAGGPNFGSMKLTWPAVLLQRKVESNGAEDADIEAAPERSRSAGGPKLHRSWSLSTKQVMQDLSFTEADEQLSQEMLKEVKAAFDLCDSDGSGEINAKELHLVMRELGFKDSKEEVGRMIAQIDETGSGPLNFDKFRCMVIRNISQDNSSCYCYYLQLVVLIENDGTEAQGREGLSAVRPRGPWIHHPPEVEAGLEGAWRRLERRGVAGHAESCRQGQGWLGEPSGIHGFHEGERDVVTDNFCRAEQAAEELHDDSCACECRQGAFCTPNCCQDPASPVAFTDVARTASGQGCRHSTMAGRCLKTVPKAARVSQGANSFSVAYWGRSGFHLPDGFRGRGAPPAAHSSESPGPEDQMLCLTKQRTNGRAPMLFGSTRVGARALFLWLYFDTVDVPTALIVEQRALRRAGDCRGPALAGKLLLASALICSCWLSSSASGCLQRGTGCQDLPSLAQMPPGPARRGLLTFVVGGEPFEIPWPYLALHSPLWADKLAEDPNLAVIELEGEAFLQAVHARKEFVVVAATVHLCRSRLSHRMSAPYLVTTHREHCASCRREVDDDEVVVSGEGFRVHLGCGTADWLAEQRQILEQLSGGSKGRRRTGDGKKQRSIDAQSILRDAAAVATVSQGDSEERPLQWQMAGEAKRRRSPEGFGADPSTSQADNQKLPSGAMQD